uniref:SWIM-type domain-containing protein n=1 Tax=Thermocrinis ruber TaxID=75906 RepID=A0A7C5WZ54_9AQUI
MVKLRLRPLKVSSEQGMPNVVPYDAGERIYFRRHDGEKVILSPQLFGKFLVLGVNEEIDPQTARTVLEFLRGDIPKFYALKDFLLREVPEGSSEKTAQAKLLWSSFTPEGVDVLSEESGRTYRVRILEGGNAECTCQDFIQRRAGTGTWCKHIKFVHQVLRERFSPKEDYPYHLPLWGVSNPSHWARLVESLGGLYKVLSYDWAPQGYYSHSREKYTTPMLGVEFEVPRGTGEEFSLLRRMISALKDRGLIQAYEHDGSVDGGEIKLTPFPATLEECLEKGNLLKSLRDLTRGLFESDLRAGMHVHINMYPFNAFSERYIREKISPIVGLFEKRFNLAVLFGRSFNRYALKRKDARGRRERYGWVNYKPLPYTIEIRLGCSKKGDPVKILLMALLLQRAFWARLEGNFTVPSSKASREKILSAFASLLSEEESKYIVPLLEEALLDSPM